MTCGRAKELMADAWQGELDKAATSTLNQHLETCADCSAEMALLGTLWGRLGDLPVPEPSQALHMRWESTLESLLPSARKPSRSPLWANFWPRNPVWQAAIAMASLVIGVLIGTTLPRDQNVRNAAEIAKLHEEIANTREMVALSLLQQQSATERLKGVNYTGRMQTMEPEVISALIQAVSSDANVNVRLAAIDALSKAAGSDRVLRSLTQSLPMQDSPMVQAALIDYLVDAHDRQALGTLRKLALQPDLNPAVRERTHFALQQLSQ